MRQAARRGASLDQLNREGIAAPGGRFWGASTINGNPARGTGILNNELYMGRLIRNRLRYIRDLRPAGGSRDCTIQASGSSVTCPELRIVELWDRVKAQQQAMHRDTRPDARAIRPFRDRRRPRFLLSALIKCGQCGAGHTKIRANLFSCAAARNKRTAAPQDRRCDRRRRSGVDARERTTLAARRCLGEN
jgi:site-specific DNA recombinase